MKVYTYQLPNETAVGETHIRIAISFMLMAFCIIMIAFMSTSLYADENHSVSITLSIDPDTILVKNSSKIALCIEAGNLEARTSGSLVYLQAPEIPTLRNVFIDPSGSSKNFSIQDGISVESQTYTYIVSPSKPGVYSIGPWIIRLADTTIVVEPAVLTVLPSSYEYYLIERYLDCDGCTADRFLSLTLDQDSIMINEKATIDLKVFLGTKTYRPLEFMDFPSPGATIDYVENFPQRYYQKMGLREYKVIRYKFQVTPKRPGPLEIGPIEIRLSWEQQPLQRKKDLFSFLSGDLKSTSIRSSKLVVYVHPREKYSGDIVITSDSLLESDYPNWFTSQRNRIRSKWFLRSSLCNNLCCEVSIDVSRSGQVLQSKINKSSGSDAYDRICLDAVQLSDPFVPLPDVFSGKSLKITVQFQTQETN
ncbi:MAG: TonB family protein [Candidatus Zixiibacteriota bacterium]